MCAICREVRLVAELLYSGLTTGAGLQTLGEEYCDILQAAGATATLLGSSLCRAQSLDHVGGRGITYEVPGCWHVSGMQQKGVLSRKGSMHGLTRNALHAGTVGVAPSFVQRSLLILLERMGPYLAERISSAARTPSEADDASVQAAQESPTVDPVPADVPASAHTAVQGGSASGVRSGHTALRLETLQCFDRSNHSSNTFLASGVAILACIMAYADEKRTLAICKALSHRCRRGRLSDSAGMGEG